MNQSSVNPFAAELLVNFFPQFIYVVERCATPNWIIKQETINRYNLILIYAGEAVFHCNHQEYRGRRGDLIFFRPGDLRCAYTFPENLLRCFAVDFLYTCPVLQHDTWVLGQADLPFHTYERIHDPYLLARLCALFKDFTISWLSGKSHHIIRCRAIFTEIIHLLLMMKTQGTINYDKIRKVEQVIHFMAENYFQKISLNELCQAAKISPSYLVSIFKEVTGKTPMDYLSGIRMNKAKELLDDNYCITEIAQRIGFSDIYYFSKCFKKWEGVAPSKYKSSH